MTQAGKTQAALVTGSSKGIGLGAAEEMAKLGFNIAINARQDSAQMDEAVAGIARHGETRQRLRHLLNSQI